MAINKREKIWSLKSVIAVLVLNVITSAIMMFKTGEFGISKIIGALIIPLILVAILILLVKDKLVVRWVLLAITIILSIPFSWLVFIIMPLHPIITSAILMEILLLIFSTVILFANGKTQRVSEV